MSNADLRTVTNDHPTTTETSIQLPLFQSIRHLSLPSRLRPDARQPSLDASMGPNNQSNATPFKLFTLPPE